MRTEVIEADTVDVAVEGILNGLNRSRQNIIYFDGWDGLGASAVLRAIAQRMEPKELARPPGLEFDQVIHIDFSKWESTRAVQREIAEQLKLPNRVMEMFDRQEEDDDFSGITDQGSRTEIAEVAVEIQRSTQGCRFLLVLHNGSNEEIDISSLGLSVYGYLTNKVVWTFQGRFRMDPRMKDKAMKKNTTDVIFSASRSKRDPQELLAYLLCEEATQVVCKHGIDLAIAVECLLYMLKLNCIRGQQVGTEYDLARHTCNYWVCDGIIQKITDIGGAWQVGEALQGEIRLDMDYHQNDLSSHLLMYTENMPHWTSPAYGYVLIPSGVIPSGMFQNFDKLDTIKLSRCSFSFSSPPFLCCCSLRFLWLDHCQHLKGADAEQLEEDTTMSWACFESLWVLDLRFTDCDRILSARMMDLMTQLRELNVMGAKNWNMSHLRGRLCNIRKLRITKSMCRFDNDVLSEMENMELLDFSGNTIKSTRSLSGPASNSCLKTVIIDGCDGLNGISLRGCKELKNLLLQGILSGLKELDLSGTSVKTLDFGGVEVTSVPNRIILLGCEKLRAILWPRGVAYDFMPRGLHINTTSTSTSALQENEFTHEWSHCPANSGSEWRICLTDTRLLRSLYCARDHLEAEFLNNKVSLHIKICTTSTLGGSNVQGTSSDILSQVQPHTETTLDSMYKDLLKNYPAAVMMMQDCPKMFLRSTEMWVGVLYVIKVIMPGLCYKPLEDAPSALLLPDFICNAATSLHVYDNSTVTSIPSAPQGSRWKELRWCLIERCPKLLTVFSFRQGSYVGSFINLQTFWASQLLSACYIWYMSVDSPFSNLKLLHLDHCPRLVHVLPLFISQTYQPLPSLETLEIVYCGDLKEVFPLDPDLQGKDTFIKFRNLRHIHLHELPSLQRICGGRMYAPRLETIKIRGCWGLRRLLISEPYYHDWPYEVDCEKEWWDSLEWGRWEKNCFQPSHPRYYKAQLPRVSLLR